MGGWWVYLCPVFGSGLGMDVSLEKIKNIVLILAIAPLPLWVGVAVTPIPGTTWVYANHCLRRPPSYCWVRSGPDYEAWV